MKISMNLSHELSQEIIHQVAAKSFVGSSKPANVETLSEDLEGYVWYKKSVFIDSAQKCKEKKHGKIILNLGENGEECETYINGVKVEEGKKMGFYMSVWNIPREFSFDQELIKWNDMNEIAIRIPDPNGGGRIY